MVQLLYVQAHFIQKLQHQVRDCGALAEVLLSMKIKHMREIDKIGQQNALLEWTEVGDRAYRSRKVI